MKNILFNWLRRYGAGIVLFLLAAGIVLSSIPAVYGAAQVEQLRMAEESLRRAVVTCYALEGRYPPDIDYLRDVYGLQLREDKYIVHYQIFAENIMPEFTVLER